MDDNFVHRSNTFFLQQQQQCQRSKRCRPFEKDTWDEESSRLLASWDEESSRLLVRHNPQQLRGCSELEVEQRSRNSTHFAELALSFERAVQPRPEQEYDIPGAADVLLTTLGPR